MPSRAASPHRIPPDPPVTTDDRLTMGEVIARTGMSASALRFYETKGLIAAERSAGNHRIGCGYLSMKACGLLNPDDELSEQGQGPVRLDALQRQAGTRRPHH